MELEKVIKSRQSTKRFNKKKPDWRDIIEVIDLARYAPMAGNCFTPRFILVDEPEKLDQIAEATTQDFVKDVGMMIVVCSEKDVIKNSFPELSEKFIKQQCGAAIQNILLSLEERKIATCWIGYFNEKYVKKILSIPDKIEVEAILPVGYAKLSSKKKSPPCELDHCLYYNKYKEKRMNPVKRLTS